MLTKLLVLSFVCMNGIVYGSKPDILKATILSQNDLCDGSNSKFDNIEVKGAFGPFYGNYIGIFGEVWKSGKKELFRVAMRTKFYTTKDPDYTFRPPFFFDAKIWNNVYDVLHSKSRNFIFTTLDVGNIFTQEKRISAQNEVIYVVEDTNKTTAHQFDPKSVDDQKQSNDYIAYSASKHSKTIYDPKENHLDRSGFLSYKYLLYHFPYEVEIKSIVIFDSNRQMNRSYFAMVYTKEIGPDGIKHYIRHYMRSEVETFRDKEGKPSISRLKWFFDERMNFCEELGGIPSAVVQIKSEESYSQKEGFQDIIYYLEFFAQKFQVMKITLKKESKHYTVQKLKDCIYDTNYLLNCNTTPSLKLAEVIPCKDFSKEEYPHILGESLFEGSLMSSSKIWWIIGIISIIIGIIALIIFGFRNSLKSLFAQKK